ncbi:MAG TPA: GNAT family protein [Pseudonocardiaceae bacterium]|jgi:RimJ/RimL family protein N-acetyltransferase|nr:GNAT family protein [Pseudonocardiaceae bacterium]
MLRGELVGLRARHEADVPILDAELYDDVVTAIRSNWKPWYPLPPGPDTSEHRIREPEDDVVRFSVVTLTDGELAGMANMAWIDRHNRTAYLGLMLRPDFRGKGLAVDIVRVLCHYGFVVLGLNRLQIETLTDNVAMIRTAEKAGFRQEGVFRQSVWLLGAFVDSVMFGMLAQEWSA